MVALPLLLAEEEEEELELELELWHPLPRRRRGPRRRRRRRRRRLTAVWICSVGVGEAARVTTKNLYVLCHTARVVLDRCCEYHCDCSFQHAQEN